MGDQTAVVKELAKMNTTLTSLLTTLQNSEVERKSESEGMLRSMHAQEDKLTVMKEDLKGFKDSFAGYLQAAKEGSETSKKGNKHQEGFGRRAKAAVNEWIQKRDLYTDVPSSNESKKFYDEEAHKCWEALSTRWKNLNKEDVRAQLVSHKSAEKKRKRKKSAKASSGEDGGSDEDEGQRTATSAGGSERVRNTAAQQQGMSAQTRKVRPVGEEEQESEVETTALAVKQTSGVEQSAAKRQKKIESPAPSKASKSVSFHETSKEEEDLEEVVQGIHKVVGYDVVGASQTQCFQALGLLGGREWSGSCLAAAKVCVFS